MKFLKTLYYIFTGAFALVALLLILLALPLPNHLRVLTVLSGSMEPAIRTGSAVVIKPELDYKVGDVITFGEMSKTKTPTTHRIAEIKTEDNVKYFITKGDANTGADQKKITQKQIIGKVVLDVPYIGYFFNIARKPIIFILILAIPAIIIIYDESKKIKNEIVRIRRKKKEEAGLSNPEL